MHSVLYSSSNPRQCILSKVQTSSLCDLRSNIAQGYVAPVKRSRRMMRVFPECINENTQSFADPPRILPSDLLKLHGEVFNESGSRSDEVASPYDSVSTRPSSQSSSDDSAKESIYTPIPSPFTCDSIQTDDTDHYSAFYTRRQSMIPELTLMSTGRPRERRYTSLEEQKISPEPRNPRIDPRKSRRFCTDFGLVRVSKEDQLPLPLPPLFPPKHNFSVSTMPSTPLESDCESSTGEDLMLDFPQPPSISPALKRMQSSHWYTEKQTSAVKDELKMQWGLNLQEDHTAQWRHSASQVISSPLLASNPLGGFHSPAKHFSLSPNTSAKMSVDEKIKGEIETEDLEMVGEALIAVGVHPSPVWTPQCKSPIAANAWLYAPGDLNSSRTSDLLRWSQSHTVPGRPTLPNHGNIPHALDEYHTHFSRLPRIIRKVASMRSDNRSELGASFSQRPIPRIRSLRFAPEERKAYAQTEKERGRERKEESRQRSWSFFRVQKKMPSFSGGFDSISRGVPRQQSTGRHRPTHKPQMSMPLAGFRDEGILVHEQYRSPAPANLGGPFLHRSTKSQPMNFQPLQELPKSFMDITPEQETKRESVTCVRRDRVKKFIARASNGILWSKHLSQNGPKSF